MAAPPIAERHPHYQHRRAPIKEAVRVATTATITIATALNNGDSLDGVTLATDDRVLVKDQSTGSQNGIYVVGVTPVRAYDQSTDDPAFGFLVYVREGTASGGKVFKNTNTAAPTIDTTALTFSALPSSDLSGVDFLVGTATGLLSGEIVAGTTPGGELGGTWASPTVDATHSGTAHTDFIAKSVLTTQDDIIVRDGTGPARLAKGSDGQVLTVDPSTHHLVWATPSGGVTDPTTTRGDMIRRNSGGSLDRLALGAANTVLHGSATDPAYSAVVEGDLGLTDNTTADASTSAHGFLKKLPGGTTTFLRGDGTFGAVSGGAGGGLVLLEQHTASTSATLDFTTCISSTYDDYLIELVSMIPSTNGDAPWIRFGTGATPTWDGGANYGWQVVNSGWGGGSVGTTGSTAAAQIALFNAGQSSSYPFSASIHLVDPGNASYRKYLFGMGPIVFSTGPASYFCSFQGGYNLTTAITAVRFMYSTGNIASGTIRIYGLAK